MALAGFVFVMFVIAGISTGHVTRNYKRAADPDSYFDLRDIKCRLAANSIRGEVEAEIEVSSHYEFDIRWYMTIPEEEGAGQEYSVPLASAAGQDVFVQRYWSSGKAYLSTKVLFHPVPLLPKLRLILEVAYKGYGPTLWQTIDVPVSTSYFPETKIQRPNSPEVISYPGSVVSYEHGDDVEVRYEVKSKGETFVHVFREVVGEDQKQLLEVSEIHESPTTNELSVSHSDLDDDWRLTTVTLTIEDMQSEDKRTYHVYFINGDSVLQITTPVLPQGHDSIFEGTQKRMQLESCDPFSKVKDELDHAKFEFKRGMPNCVYCMVSHTDSIDMNLFDGQYLPVGGGPTHAIYFVNRFPDVAKMNFIVYGPSFHSYDFGGNYTCSVDGTPGVERTFEIIMVQ